MLPIFDRIGPFRLSVDEVIDKDVSKHSTIDCDARTATGLRLPVSAIERLFNIIVKSKLHMVLTIVC